MAGLLTTFAINLPKRLGMVGLDANRLAGAGVPGGYTRTTYNGVPVTFNGAIVFDDGKNFYYMRTN